MDILNSSGFKIGVAKIDGDLIIVNNNNKPLLIIEDDLELIQKIKNKDESGFEILFNKYYLLIGEIAALYNMTYSTTRKHMIKMGIDTKSKAGRRNSSYGKTFSDERKAKIGAASRGRKITPYERTPEIKNKISESLLKYYSEHEVSEETRIKLSQAWKDGRYENANMGRGYNGFFYSIKNNKKFFFRSLLELCYLIQIENNGELHCSDCIKKVLIQSEQWDEQGVTQSSSLLEYSAMARIFVQVSAIELAHIAERSRKCQKKITLLRNNNEGSKSLYHR